jgi:hypothetical protein
MRVSSEALAKEDWSFGGLRPTAGATVSRPWGFTSRVEGRFETCSFLWLVALRYVKKRVLSREIDTQKPLDKVAFRQYSFSKILSSIGVPAGGCKNMALRKTSYGAKGFRKFHRTVIFLGMLMGTTLSGNVSLAGEPIPVFVSIPPQKYFVEKIGGSCVQVSVMVPPGANPHIYEPRPNQMTALSKSRIYFAIGVTFETVWLPKFAKLNPQMRIVHTDKGIDKMAMVEHPHEAREGPKHKARTKHPHRD